MSLLDDLNAIEPMKPKLPEWLIALKPEERAAFDKTLANPGVSSEKIATIVRNHGGSTTRTAVDEYRNRVATR